MAQQKTHVGTRVVGDSNSDQEDHFRLEQPEPQNDKAVGAVEDSSKKIKHRNFSAARPLEIYFEEASRFRTISPSRSAMS